MGQIGLAVHEKPRAGLGSVIAAALTQGGEAITKAEGF